MITLSKQDNTVLLYSKLVSEPLPVQVHVTLKGSRKSNTLIATVQEMQHFYLLQFADVLTTTDQVELSVTSLDDTTIYYKENAKIT